MRKWNTILSLAALVLLLLHGVLESFHLIGTGGQITKLLPRAALTLLLLHAALGVKYTADSLLVWKKTGAGYFRENRLFLARRISGFLILVLLFFHVGAFGEVVDGVFHLHPFTGIKLAHHLLLAAALAVHVLTNLRPLLLSLGVNGRRRWVGDLLFVLTVLLLFMAAAFVIYFLHWNAL